MERLCRVRDIQRAVNQYEANFAKSYGISLNEGMVLCSLAGVERLSSGELGELLGLTHSNTSKVLASVESKGLVERVVGNADRRRMYFSLTEGGRRMLSTIGRENIGMPEILTRVTQ